MITRRLFARALPVIPVAMKAAAAAGVSDGIGVAAANAAGAVASGNPVGPSGIGESYLDYLKRSLAEHIANRAMRRARAARFVSRLDPDLASSRSFSLAARIRLQGERDEERDFEEQRLRLLKEIADTAKRELL